MEKMSNTMVMGIGTGRCGTLCLSDFMKQQPQMAVCSHEHLKWPWYARPEDITINGLGRYTPYENSVVGEVGSFLLPHVRRISEFFKETKLIVIKRDKAKTVQSWMGKTHKTHNYWVPHTLGIWKDDPWDRMFPKFDMEREPKEKAISAYYDMYYQSCEDLKKDFEVLEIRTETLDEMVTRRKICLFCGFDLKKCRFHVPCRKNEGPTSTAAKPQQQAKTRRGLPRIGPRNLRKT